MTKPLQKINDFIIRFANARMQDVINDPRLSPAERSIFENLRPEERSALESALENLHAIVNLALENLALYRNLRTAKDFIDSPKLGEPVISVSIDEGKAGKEISLSYKQPEIKTGGVITQNITLVRLALLDFLLSQGHRRLGKCEICNKFFLLRRAARKGERSGRLCYKQSCKKEFERRRIKQKRDQRKAQKKQSVAITG